MDFGKRVLNGGRQGDRMLREKSAKGALKPLSNRQGRDVLETTQIIEARVAPFPSTCRPMCLAYAMLQLLGPECWHQELEHGVDNGQASVDVYKDVESSAVIPVIHKGQSGRLI